MPKRSPLEFIITHDGFRPDFLPERNNRFFPDQYRGMYDIVLEGSLKDSSPSLDYIRRITESFFFQLERTPSLELERERASVSYDPIETGELVSDSPFILGSQNITEEWILSVFDRYLGFFRSDIASYPSTV